MGHTANPQPPRESHQQTISTIMPMLEVFRWKAPAFIAVCTGMVHQIRGTQSVLHDSFPWILSLFRTPWNELPRPQAPQATAAPRRLWTEQNGLSAPCSSAKVCSVLSIKPRCPVTPHTSTKYTAWTPAEPPRGWASNWGQLRAAGSSWPARLLWKVGRWGRIQTSWGRGSKYFATKALQGLAPRAWSPIYIYIYEG